MILIWCKVITIKLKFSNLLLYFVKFYKVIISINYYISKISFLFKNVSQK